MTKAVQNKNVHIVCVFMRKPPQNQAGRAARPQSKSALRKSISRLRNPNRRIINP